ncbi:MAG TPA: glycosyltransferase [Thermoanaerobaculia bacterium]|nr:glycosyltransferase [Thermoanaerobaculia bacterium]
MSDRTLLIINYHSASLTARAIETARQSSSAPLRTMVVDNSESGDEMDRLRTLPIDELIAASSNLGYGRGINLALPRCREGELIISNPDVEFTGPAIDLLCAALDHSAEVAGPSLFWDESLQWMLPPAENTSVWSKAAEAAFQRWSFAGSFIGRRRCATRVKFWSGVSDVHVDHISGAVMAMRTDVLRRLGGFDERFELYFEETDLMTRLRKQGGAVRLVRSARCRHIFNQSSSSPDESGRLYAKAEELYLGKWSHPWALEALGRMKSSARMAAPTPSPKTGGARLLRPGEPIGLPGPAEDYLVEASPLRSFWSAAGCFPSERKVLIPSEIVETYKGRELFARVVDRSTLRPIPGLEFEISVK